MAIIKNYPIRLNRDDDVRRLEPTDMTYALNVQSSKSSGRNEGVLENIKGTTQISFTAPSGTNKCIGTITHAQSNNMFFFIWNSNDNHSIYYVNDITGIVRLVMQTSVLNFNKNGYIVGEAIQGRSSEEILLYFTDNINPVRKVNVQKALAGTYGTITDEYIKLIKYAPSTEPTWEYTVDNSVVYNNVYNRNYQFRCRYIYDDGEYSAYSAASSLTYNDKQLLSSLKDSTDPYTDLNNIVVTVPTGSKIVDKIEVIARRGDNGEWRDIKTLKNTTSQSTLSFNFKDDGSYPAADPIETNKYFDNVPLQAESIAMVNSRLFLGNYIDGYNPNPDIANLNTGNNGITLKARSKNFDIPEFTSATVTSPITSGSQASYVISFASITPSVGDMFVLNDYTSIEGSDNVMRITPTIFETYEVQNGDSISDVASGLLEGIEQDITFENNVRRRISQSGSSVQIEYTLTSGSATPSTVNRVNNSGRYTALAGAQSLKKGSKYSLGIVEYDEAGRASTVNVFPDNEVYIPFYSEVTPKTKDMIGAMSIDYRINENIKPSVRTTKWSWAITENTSVGNFIQYSATGAYSVSNPVYPNDDTVYISIRGLQSQPSSYNTAFDAQSVVYNYQDGDRLRIISYIDDNDNRVITRGNLDFRITSGRVYNEDDSPIVDNADLTSTTGYILGLQPITESGWDASSSSFWNKSTPSSSGPNANKGSVIFEIYRPKPQTEDTDLVYYEIGGIQDVQDAGTSSRKFAGSLRTQGDTQSYAVASQTIDSVTIAQDSINFVIGDTVICKDGGASQISNGTITDIQSSGGSTVVYILYETESATTVATIELEDTPAAGNIVQGDVWVRPRLIRNDNFVNAQTFIVFPVEDYNVSDFFPSASWGKGRANAFTENSKQVRRFSTVTYSETYFNETNVNGLSSFNNGLANFQQYNQSYGAIRRLYSNDVYLACFQENKIGRIPIQRKVITTADGGTSLTLSSDILNEIDYYKGDYGLTKAESFVAYDGDFYGWDIKRAKVWELGAAGLQLVSDYKMSSYIEEASKEILPFYQNGKILLGLDREFDSIYVSTLPSVRAYTISDGTNETDETFGLISDDGINLVINASPENTGSLFSPNRLSQINRRLSQMTIPLSSLGGYQENLNLVPEYGSFEYSGDIQDSGKAESTFEVTISGTTYYATGYYDFDTSEITVPKSQDGFNLELGTSTDYTGFTLGYNKNYNIWTSFYSFIPEMYGNINYSCYSFKDGALYKHNTNETYNEFYGSRYDSVWETNFNQEPSRVKIFDATSIEGNRGDISATLNTNLNSTSIPSTYFSEKEGFYQAMVPRTTSNSSFSTILGGGTGSFSSSNLTITGLNVYQLGIRLGDEVYNSSGTLQGTVTAIVDADTITVSAGTGSGFFYISRPDEVIEGDRLRGYYCTTRYTCAASTFLEVFAVNMNVTNSKLHNT